MASLFLCFAAVVTVANAGQAPYACDQANSTLRGFAFCNISLPIERRVQDYVSRLTLEEKISQLVSTAPSIPRLGVPAYEWWSEALHGVSWSPGVAFGHEIPAATSFPMPNTLAATFNSSLFYRMGQVLFSSDLYHPCFIRWYQVVSTEIRAMHSLNLSGLTFWNTNINLFRDPRWGRGQETPGEDPWLSGHFAAQYIRGLQDLSPQDDRLKVSACCKHLTAYDMENSTGAIRFDFNALVTPQDLADSYNAPFQTCVEDGDASCIMCAYTRVNGVPVCADRHLLTDTVRNRWKFNGYITTDRDSIETFFVYTNYAATPEDAVADALLAGVDLNAGSYLGKYTMSAIKQNKLSAQKVDEAITHLARVQMRVGLFDGNPKTQKQYGSIGPEHVCTEEHTTLALEAARQGIVLLKNSNRALPLSRADVQKLALVGPHANATAVLTGNYAGIPCRYTTALQGLQKYTSVLYAMGCQKASCKSASSFGPALEAASEADAVVLVLGLDLTYEAEGIDRTSLRLPGLQEELASKVIDAAKGPVVLVILSGGSVDVSFAQDDSRVSAIIWAGYPGEDGGQALAEIIFGDYNPGGRLPVTWYLESYLNSMNLTNMNMRPDASTGYPGRTYRFYTGPVLYKFGHGLSYTKVSTKFIQAPKLFMVPKSTSCCSASPAHVKLSVHNEGDMPLTYALLLFWIPPNAGVLGTPQKQLAAFQRLWLEPNSTEVATFDIDPCKHFAYANRHGKMFVPAGKHGLLACDGSRLYFNVDFQLHSSA